MNLLNLFALVAVGFVAGVAIQPLPVCPWCNQRHDMPYCRPVRRLNPFLRSLN